MAKKKGLDDKEVVTLVDAKMQNCVGWYDSKLSKERSRVLKYYNGQLPRKQREGTSSYISTDVYDSVESMKAQILETFSGNVNEMVTFDPQGANDVPLARQATAYCDYVVWRENPGFQICQDVIHDGLSARVGVVKVYWDEGHEDTDHEFEGLPYDTVSALAQHKDVTELDANHDEATDTYKGTFTRRKDTSKVCIDPVPPEEFLISPRSRSIHKAQACGQRVQKTKAELIDMGYDKAIVDTLVDNDGKPLEFAEEVIDRNSPVESAQASDDPIQPELGTVTLYEAYVRMDMKEGKGVKLYKVCYVASTLLDAQEVDRVPFMAFVPLPIPYMFYGNNFAQRVIPYQNARTVLTRGVLDHTTITTNPRWTVLKGGLLNPKELMDNRLGGLVNINRPDAVAALEQQSLNPFVFQTLEMLKGNKEESTGISALSQGLNKDAISTQNSTALVDNMVQLSQQRQKIIARNFAYGFLIPLYIEAYRLVLVNADKEKLKIVEVSGALVPVDPKTWVERTSVRASLHLGYGERDREVAKYVELYTRISQDQALAPMFKPKNRYTLLTDGMKKAGFQNYADYITSPDDPSVQPPPPDPLKVQELQIKDKQAQASLMTAQETANKNQRLADLDSIKQQLDAANARFDQLMKTREDHRMDAETANRIDVSQREMTLAETNPTGDNIVVSPH